jgi:hypothetical protein
LAINAKIVRSKRVRVIGHKGKIGKNGRQPKRRTKFAIDKAAMFTQLAKAAFDRWWQKRNRASHWAAARLGSPTL